jgi:hypothetical protein
VQTGAASQFFLGNAQAASPSFYRGSKLALQIEFMHKSSNYCCSQHNTTAQQTMSDNRIAASFANRLWNPILQRKSRQPPMFVSPATYHALIQS